MLKNGRAATVLATVAARTINNKGSSGLACRRRPSSCGLLLSAATAVAVRRRSTLFRGGGIPVLTTRTCSLLVAAAPHHQHRRLSALTSSRMRRSLMISTTTMARYEPATTAIFTGPRRMASSSVQVPNAKEEGLTTASDDDKERNNNKLWSAAQLAPSTQVLAQDLMVTGDSSEAVLQRRRALSKAITLVESRHPVHMQQADLLLTRLLQQQSLLDDSFRLGLAGSPGAGKSTLIEALGMFLLDHESDDVSDKDESDNKNQTSKQPSQTEDDLWIPERLAVIAVDPSDTQAAGGSILGDKTRMTQLSRHESAFVRPAPSGAAAQSLGGLAASTSEAVALCQLAQYPLVLVETVGIGQSDVAIAQACDLLLVLVPPSGGDGLQGVKKGLIQTANVLVVTKADGSLLPTAKRTAADYRGAMQFWNTVSRDNDSNFDEMERPRVVLVSSVTKDGLRELWQFVSDYRKHVIQSKRLQRKRQQQHEYWTWQHVQRMVQDQMLQRQSSLLRTRAVSGNVAVTPRVAAKEILQELYPQR